MILVYTVVGVFLNGSFAVGGEHAYLLSPGTSGTEVLIEDEQIDAYEDLSWIDSIGAFFGSVLDAFTYLIGFLTFGLIGAYGIIPVFMQWLLLLMVLPVWIAIIYWLAPYVVKAISAIGNWIPFT